MVTMLDQIPASKPLIVGDVSLTNLAVELRMEVWNHLFNTNNVSRSYGYTGLPARAIPVGRPPPWSTCEFLGDPQLPAVNEMLQNYWIQLHLLESENRKRLEMARRERPKLNGTVQQWETIAYEVEQEMYQFAQSVPPMPVSVTTTHSMILVSKQLGAEYRQTYFNRTRFFLRIGLHNVLEGIPHLITASPERLIFPNFWRTSPELFENLRSCTLYIELGDIEKAVHVDRLHPSGVLKDTTFDTNITTAIQALIASMRQLQNVKLVWSTSCSDRVPLSLRTDPTPLHTFHHAWQRPRLPLDKAMTDYNRGVFIDAFANTLMAKKSIRQFYISIGDEVEDLDIKWERGKSV